MRAGVRECVVCFFFNDTATTEIYTLSLHDALPIYRTVAAEAGVPSGAPGYYFDSIDALLGEALVLFVDRKSTRLNSSHANISYAVFCLKKKKDRFLLSFSRSFAYL